MNGEPTQLELNHDGYKGHSHRNPLDVAESMKRWYVESTLRTMKNEAEKVMRDRVKTIILSLVSSLAERSLTQYLLAVFHYSRERQHILASYSHTHTQTRARERAKKTFYSRTVIKSLVMLDVLLPKVVGQWKTVLTIDRLGEFGPWLSKTSNARKPTKYCIPLTSQACFMCTR